jgi:DNA topoisomerase-1
MHRLSRYGRFLGCEDIDGCGRTMNIDANGKPIAETVAEAPCEACGGTMILKTGKHGRFYGCATYPSCEHTVPCDEEGQMLRRINPDEIDEYCPECNSPMVVRFGRGSAFLGCSQYPDCEGKASLPEGTYVERSKPRTRSRRS